MIPLACAAEDRFAEMDEVERFLADLRKLLASSADNDELNASAHRQLATFIGRAADRGDQYAPSEEVSGLLAEARRRLQEMTFEGQGRYLRVEVLTELDKALAAVQPRK